MNRKSIKFLILLGLAVFSFSLIGCEKNHEKISKKLLKEKQEDRCLELIEALEDELKDKVYNKVQKEKIIQILSFLVIY